MSNPLVHISDRFQLWKAQHHDFRTTRKVVIFESDDWGSIRVPSLDAWNQLKSLGYAVDQRPYERYDTLESDDDLTALYQVLRNHRDVNGHYPIITTNMIVANPDFDKIKECDYQHYYYETIRETYAHYPKSHHVLELIQDGVAQDILNPQFHGREHYNITQWLNALQLKDPDTIQAFDVGMCGIFPKSNPHEGNQFMVALRTNDSSSQQFVLNSLSEGIILFENIFGYRPQSFTAPCYTWDDTIEKQLADLGIWHIQSGRKQKYSNNSHPRFRSTGGTNTLKQLYSVRNCSFEPATTNEIEKVVETTLQQIADSFHQHRLAIISTHRINYVSRINPTNRDTNLQLLDTLLTRLTSKFPDIEFSTSQRVLSTILPETKHI